MAESDQIQSAGVRCPVCGGSLEAYRTTRYATAGGRWRRRGKEAWTARCANGHEATDETLPVAVRRIGAA